MAKKEKEEDTSFWSVDAKREKEDREKLLDKLNDINETLKEIVYYLKSNSRY